ncbi:MAG: hypothetical protein LBH92_05030 [Bacteroidales bacterium]|jgi:hypothetical protein|nr:hypothetical protein [Bacteroidales bacterium]
MNDVALTIIIAVIFLALAFAGIAIKMFFKKGTAFQRHCASQEAGKENVCVCKRDEKKCRYRAIHHPVETAMEEKT